MDETLLVTIIHLQYAYIYNLIIAYKYGLLQNAWIFDALP